MHSEFLERAEEFKEEVGHLEAALFHTITLRTIKNMDCSDLEGIKTLLNLMDTVSDLATAQARELADIEKKIDKLLLLNRK